MAKTAPRPDASNKRPSVGLFVTCLVDLFRPSVGFAAVKLLERAGCDVHVPTVQTCCGQPAYNSGDTATSSSLARQVMDAFAGHDFIVVPSGSCAGMLKHHYPKLLRNDPEYKQEVQGFCDRVHELVSFLTDVRGVTKVDAAYRGTVTYHDGCAGLREMGIHSQPRQLLESVEGLDLEEMVEAEVCCGFGGTFCVKYPDISNHMVVAKTHNIAATGADLVVAGDLGCLMNIAGRLSRDGRPVSARHVAELLADMTTPPPLTGRIRGTRK